MILPNLDDPRFSTVTLATERALTLDSGAELSPVQVAWRSYGTLNAARDNAVLICHALTGDQFVAEDHPLTGKPGWWEAVVGPGLTIDTDRHFVLCANVLGGCMGTTGPASPRPGDTGGPWGLDFPLVTIHDMVRLQALLLDHLGIEQLYAVVGGSMGAMQALSFAALYPRRTRIAVAIAGSWRHSAQNIAFHEVGRQAIMADPHWNHGRYFDGEPPRSGLAVARMTAHVTYLSEAALQAKFGRRLQDRERPTYGFDADFQVESYLRHQGSTFVDRFDAASYLYITRAMDYFDLSDLGGGHLAAAFQGSPVRFTLISFTSDWLFPTSESRTVVNALNAAGAAVSFAEIATDRGHDAFLLDEPEFHRVLAGALAPPPTAHRQSREPRLPGRVDFPLIAEMIGEAKTGIDVGCGDGALLAFLAQEKGLVGRGLEKDAGLVTTAVARGLAVVQGSAERDLELFADDAFDVAILSLTLQNLRKPHRVLAAMARVAPTVVISFLNFGHWRVRRALAVGGRMPVTEALPHRWWETPNIHHLTIRDFPCFCEAVGVEIERAIILDDRERLLRAPFGSRRANLFGQQAIFRVRRRG